MRTIILLTLLGTAFAFPKNVQKIVGGSVADVLQYPFMSNMQYNFYGLIWSQVCGGALITSSSVLSAAHCYDADSATDWRVRVGTSKASSGGTVHNLAEIIVHPQFDSGRMFNDVAILKLATPVAFSDVVQLARIAGSSYTLPDNTEVINIGWGALADSRRYLKSCQDHVLENADFHETTGHTNLAREPEDSRRYLKSCQDHVLENADFHETTGHTNLAREPESGGDVPEDLYEVTVQIINHKLCTERYAYLKSLPNYSTYPDITADMLCSGILDAGGKSACQGDNGGPLIHDQNVVVGIVSWGYGCADPYYPGVNARVSHHSGWIIANGAV